MKSETVLIFICIISLSWINPCKGEDVYGKAELTTENDSLIFNIKLFNKSGNHIFIPLSYWIFAGDTLGNLTVLPFQTYFLNTIEYLKSKYDHFDSWIDFDFHSNYLKKIPSFMIVNPDDSLSFEIKVEISTKLLDKFYLDTYNFILQISYGDAGALRDIGEIIDCSLDKVITNDVVDDSLSIFIDSEKKQTEWYKFNELVDCELDEKKSMIFSLGFMRKIEIITQLKLPKKDTK